MGAAELTREIVAAADGSLGTLEESQSAELVAACERLKVTLESPLELTSRILFGVSHSLLLFPVPSMY